MYNNLVIVRNVCKLMNFENCQVGFPEHEIRANYKKIIKRAMDKMVSQVT